MVDSFYNIIETCTDDCHICFVFTVLCQHVAAVEELAEDVVSAIMILDIAKKSDAVPAAEEMPAAVEVGKQSDVITWYTFLTNCNIKGGEAEGRHFRCAESEKRYAGREFEGDE